jgi:hypothetical protein
LRPSVPLISKFWLGPAILSLVVAVGCGSGGSVILPHPTGNYSDASLSGSYVYQIHGFLIDGESYREIGVFTADGSGHIAAGSDDFASSSSGGVISNTSSVTGSYSIANDGTGSITLNSTGLGSFVQSTQVNLAVTLVSTSKVDLMEGDNFAVGAGDAEVQDSSVAGAAPSGTFVFRLHTELDPQTFAPSSSVGAVTISNGSVSGGIEDRNRLTGGTSSVSLTGGTFSGSAGTASLTDSTNFTANFLYLMVNSGKFVFLLNAAGVVGSGSAELQSGAVGNGLSGSYAFGSRGDDSLFNADVATVGQFTTNQGGIGFGTLTGIEDVMQEGTYSANVGLSGCMNATSDGRVVITTSSGTACTGTVQQIFWMVDPSRAFFLDSSTSTVEDGTADLQAAASFSASTFKGQFAMVMDGIDIITTAEALARLGTLQFDGSSKLTLSELANNSTSGTVNPGAMTGSYQVGSNGRIVGSVSNSGGGLDFVIYAVSGSDAYALQVDGNTNTSGLIELQH